MKAQIKGGECYWAKCGDMCGGGFIPKQVRLCDPRSGPTQRDRQDLSLVFFAGNNFSTGRRVMRIQKTGFTIVVEMKSFKGSQSK
jgi:hypothetical protein